MAKASLDSVSISISSSDKIGVLTGFVIVPHKATMLSAASPTLIVVSIDSGVRSSFSSVMCDARFVLDVR